LHPASRTAMMGPTSVERAADSTRLAPLRAQVVRICREIIAPMVKNDGGEMYLVKVEGEDVYIHLAGTCAGCPGASITGDKMILPALRTAAPKLRVFVTTGVKVPEGAEKLGA
jgi:Fe-S cluster biogenesis protein NfuA